MIHENILTTIGRTPTVRLNRIANSDSDLFAKIESFNPMGSIKDRLAIAIIDAAERSGALKPGQTVVEATSGNTGIALAMVCAARGYPFVATMADSFSIERRKIMRALGARVILTPAAERASGMVRRAEELARQHGWFLARQFDNPANPAYHRNTTAPEILADFASRRLDYCVMGWGTGGTITGVGEVLKAARPGLKIVACEPTAAPMLTSSTWQSHKIQGITPDFFPKVLNREIVDQVLTITDEEARSAALDLARKEGIFAGMSSGAAMAAALKLSATADPGSAILVMLPDTGERYLSSYLCDDIAEGSDDDWLEEQSEQAVCYG